MFKKGLFFLLLLLLVFNCSESEEAAAELPVTGDSVAESGEARNTTTFSPRPITPNEASEVPTTFEQLRSPFTRFAKHYKKNTPPRMPVDFSIGQLESLENPAVDRASAFIVSLLKAEPDYSYAYDEVRLGRQLTEFYDEAGISEENGLPESALERIDIRIGVLSERNGLFDGKIRIKGDNIDLRARIILVKKELFLVDSIILHYTEEGDDEEWYPETFSKPFGW